MDVGVELDGQYRLLREGAGFLDRSSRGKLEVRGPDAADFLQSQLTNDVEALSAGEGCYAALLDRKGHLQADARVLRLDGGRFWLDTEPIAREVVHRHLSTYRIGREAEVDDLTDGHAILSVIGPAAAEVTGAGPLRPEHAHRDAELGGVRCRLVATDLGVDVFCERAGAQAVAAELLAGGAGEVSEDAAEILRVESGRPRFGAEMTQQTMPQEAGINERAVSFTKGCYIGQETVARLHYKGKPNRHLRGLRLEAPAEDGAVVRLGGRDVGRIGTAVLSPAHGPIALAILRREAEPGATVAVGDEGVPGQVIELPF